MIQKVDIDWRKIVDQKRAVRDEAVRPWLVQGDESLEVTANDAAGTPEIEKLVALMRDGVVSAEDVTKAHIRRVARAQQ